MGAPSSRAVPQALVVHLQLPDLPYESEQKRLRRCLEIRESFRQLFMICAGRELGKHAPVDPIEPSLIVYSPEDQQLILLWAHKYRQVIHSTRTIDGTLQPQFSDNSLIVLEKKKKKKRRQHTHVSDSDETD